MTLSAQARDIHNIIALCGSGGDARQEIDALLAGIVVYCLETGIDVDSALAAARKVMTG